MPTVGRPVTLRPGPTPTAEATFTRPGRIERALNSALEVGRQADRAQAARLTLTHLQPGTDVDASIDAARLACAAPIDVAIPGLVIDLD
jgi:ribonuclease BN (tRNA processing enzyme)